MMRFIALYTIALCFTVALYGDSKTEARLKSEVSNQAATIALQSATIADLKSQLAAAHIQTAKAIGAASGTREALKSRRAEDTAATVKGCKDSSLDVIATMSVELADLAKEQKGRSRNHSETMDKIDRQNTMTMRLLVLIAVFVAITAAVIGILFRARSSNG